MAHRARRGLFPAPAGHPDIVLNDYPRDLVYEGVWQVSLLISLISLVAMGVTWIWVNRYGKSTSD